VTETNANEKHIPAPRVKIKMALIKIVPGGE